MQNKVALVTGGARRIGETIVKVLHQAGYQVIIHYCNSALDAKKLQQSCNALRADSAHIVQADLTDLTQIETMVKQAVSEWGQIDLLVNNASGFYPTRLGETTESQWDDLISSNLKGAFFLTQALSENLIAQRGSVVNIADVHAQRPMHDYAVYCIAQAGVTMMTQAFAKELAPSVRVNAIAPGVMLWPEQQANHLSTEQQQKILARIALDRIGDPQQLAELVLFLSEQADYMTGQILTLDGGRSLNM